MVSFSICLVGFLLDLKLDQVGRHFFQFIHFVLQGHDVVQFLSIAQLVFVPRRRSQPWCTHWFIPNSTPRMSWAHWAIYSLGSHHARCSSSIKTSRPVLFFEFHRCHLLFMGSDSSFEVGIDRTKLNIIYIAAVLPPLSMSWTFLFSCTVHVRAVWHISDVAKLNGFDVKNRVFGGILY